MPLAKTVVERSSLPGGLVGSDQLSVLVVDALRQLAQLAVICDVIFTELMSDVDDIHVRVMSLTSRTARLADRLDTLDALTVNVRTYHARLILCRGFMCNHCMQHAAIIAHEATPL